MKSPEVVTRAALTVVSIATMAMACAPVPAPDGQAHPGVILHEDRIDGRTWTVPARDVPPTIAFVRVDDRYVPVVRIEITGTPSQRRITKFGPDGQMLESTVQAPPPPRR